MTSDSTTETTDAPSGRGKRLVIVESPAKARTIAQFLGPDYIVESSIGHIRDLPSTAAEIPAKYKKEPWARLGVNVDQDFEPLYIIPAAKKQQVTKLRKLLKQADELYLATDEDREGEAIAWHLLEVLKPTIPVRRMVFHEITREAIEEALANPREVDLELVHAQEARRILDRLFGYEVSPVLWKKVRPRLSAGRVQSAALRIAVERERARMKFVSAGYWDVEATLRTRETAEPVAAKMIELDGRRLASGRDFDPESGLIESGGDVTLLDEGRATALAETLRSATFIVASVNERPYTQRPPAPFITSSLQQEAARKLRYTAQRTMRVAQNLYENGYITYMRTDSVNLSGQAIEAARRQVTLLYGPEYLPDSPRRYSSKAKGAQEAHEAIRPAGDTLQPPEVLRAELDNDTFGLYDLIWKRTVASQMRDATGLRTQVRLEADAGEPGTAVFQTSGKVITFPGFLRAYVEGSDDPDADLEDQERILPPLREGQQLDPTATEAKGHETQSPARYTEATLIRELEERGIGRPSTYAQIIQTIQDRGYVWKKATALVPTFVAFAVVNLLEQHFPDLIDLDFTALMESDLDEISEGRREATPWLRAFYFGSDGDGEGHTMDIFRTGLKDTIGNGWEEIDARAISSIPLGIDDEGREVAVRVGRYGPYVQAGDSDVRADIQDDMEPDEMTLEEANRLLAEAQLGDRVIGDDPASGEHIYIKTGRFGPYVQLGEDPPRPPKGKKAPKDQPKPKRSSLWPEMTMETLTIEEAIELLSYPRVVGKHPSDGTEITAQDGPNGPYLRWGTESRSLTGGHEQMRSVTVDEAVTILAAPRQRRGRTPQAPLAELGKHPDSGDEITLREGRFGPYVTDGTVNASIPKGRDPSKVTLDDAIEMLVAREEKMRAEGKDPRAKKPSRPRRKSRPKARSRAKSA